MTVTLAWVIMALWLIAVVLSFAALVAYPKRWIIIPPNKNRLIGMLGITGAIGEAATLYAGGFWQ